jgi:hypothetical protein
MTCSGVCRRRFIVVWSSFPIMVGSGLAQRVDQFTGTRSLVSARNTISFEDVRHGVTVYLELVS